jgi:hypothetical protein
MESPLCRAVLAVIVEPPDELEFLRGDIHQPASFSLLTDAFQGYRSLVLAMTELRGIL